MTTTRRKLALLYATAALAAWAGYGAALASAQGQEPPASPKQQERRDRPRGRRGAPPPARERRAGLPLGRFPGFDLFRPSPEDVGPLTPAERRELMGFVQKRVPNVHRWLKQLRRRDPAAFEQRLQDAAPRLRQLRRVFERDPRLARNLVRHSENLERIQRARRAWIESEQDPGRRRRIRAAVRRLIAQNLRTEALVLDERLRQLSEQREERIDAWVGRLQSDEIDLAGEPVAVRELVRRWRAAQTGDEQTEFEAELRRICAERIDREVARLRKRAARMRANAVEEVDRRMNRWMSHAKRGPGPHGPLRRGNERKGDDGH